MTARCQTAILISGRGSNMQALIEAAKAPDYPAQVVLIVSNRPDAAGLEFAASQGITTVAIDHKAFASRADFDRELDEALKAHGIELVALAGFMRIFDPQFAKRWQGRMINIHPSLLPAYPGLNTHQRALADGATEHGCSVHFVIPELDAGPVIAQGRVIVRPDDTETSLAARVLKVEHQLYPRALAAVASGLVRLEDGRAVGADQVADLD
ncbi:MAG: phosphoribosylglycinamide formyltransferase [Aestuariivirgaceae bacterium]